MSSESDVLSKRLVDAIRVASQSSGVARLPVGIDGGEHLLRDESKRNAVFAKVSEGLSSGLDGKWETFSPFDASESGVTQAKRAFERVVNRLTIGSARRELLWAIDAIPWSPALASALVERLKQLTTLNRLVLVVPPSPEFAVDSRAELFEAALDVSRAVNARAVVFCECPAQLAAHEFLRIPAPAISLGDFVNYVEKRVSAALPSAPMARNGQSRLRNLLAWLLGASEEDSRRDLVSWVEFIAQCTYPNLRAVDQVVAQIVLADRQLEEWETQHRPNSMTSGASRSFDIEREEFRNRATFMAILYVTHPETVNRARSSLGGTFALYGSQVRALAGSSGTGLSATVKTSNDPESLGAHFQRAMSSVGALSQASFEPEPLVARFASASSLRRHIEWQFGATSLKEARLSEWEDWIQKSLPAHIDALATGQPAARLAVPETLLEDDTRYPEALLERASWILDVLELDRPSVIPFGRDYCAEVLGPQGDRLESYLSRALAISDHAIRFEALVIRSRHLTLRGRFPEAQLCLREARKLLDAGSARMDPRSLLVDLASAYVCEVGDNLQSAPSLYSKVAAGAEEVNADEVLWRAVFGVMRCGLAQVQHGAPGMNPSPPELCLRAQVLLRIQQSRSPRLINLLTRERPKVFISYRRESQSIAARISEHVNASPDADAWIDLQINAEAEDFAPKIQREIWDCDALLFVVSKHYWDSLYCCCEMWSASSRHGLGARQAPIFWLVVDDEISATGPDKTARQRFEELIVEAGNEARNEPNRSAAQHFLSDVPKNRILGRGEPIVEFPLRACRDVQTNQLSWVDAPERQEEVLDALVRRFARLRDPAPGAVYARSPERAA